MDTQDFCGSLEPVSLTTQTDSMDYNMCHANRGMCLIFDNENFAPSRGIGNYPPRIGSHVDAANLSNIFTFLGFDVHIFKDKTASQIRLTLKSVAEYDHSQNDCFICCVLTHGEYGSLHSYDDRYPIDNIFVNFLGHRCPSLVGKPKLFFIQACQGTRLDNGVPVMSQDSYDGVATYFKIPTYADFLIAQSTIPGFFSFRNTDKGSWFISALVEVIHEYHQKLDLLSIMTIVSQRVAYYYTSNTVDPAQSGMKQVPCITSMLTRRVFFESKSIKI